MARRCRISGKGPSWGNNVSHANNKRRKVWHTNLHKKRLFDSESGRWVTVRVSSRILRSIDKNGLAVTLRDKGIKLESLR